jgi:phosphoribosylformylglycinamidine synthase
VLAIGRSTEVDRIRFVHAGGVFVDEPVRSLRARWSQVTHQMARRRDDPMCADEEMTARLDRVPLTAKLTFDLDRVEAERSIASSAGEAVDLDRVEAERSIASSAGEAGPMLAIGARPRVAILREQGVNGQVEMAAAFTRAGFDAVDVHMTDLVEGSADLSDCSGAVACGGFSFGDVLGAGRGWAATFRYNARARHAIQRFIARSDTFVLGVCNGCQMLADLAPDLVPSVPWPRFVRNRSDRFEARLVLVRIEENPSIFFKDMAGSRIPIANAHGEGRAELSPARLRALEAGKLVCARFVDGSGEVADTYPANPNGSPRGIAAITTPDGRITAIMPHPERVFRTVQLSWHPPEWGEDSPWMKMFRNARDWCG